MKAKQTGLPQADPFPIRMAFDLSLYMLDPRSWTLERLSRFDHDRHICRPNPIECGACHGDGTGGLPA